MIISSTAMILIQIEQQNAEAAYRREHQRADEAEAEFRLARRSVDEQFRGRGQVLLLAEQALL